MESIGNGQFKEIRTTPILGESHTETIYLWQWVINLAAEMEPSSSQRQMEPHGIMEHLELKIISMELPTGIVLSLQSEIREPSSPHQMEHLGIIEHLELIKISMELPTETATS